MPFTVSHAVVALGVRRLPVPVAAVAVGAMAPDAVLFAPFLPDYAFAHSWQGVVTIDLVVALVVVGTWWWLVRPAWAPVVPGFRSRLPAGWSSPPAPRASRLALVVAGCVLGSVTHVVWDGFTHGAGFAVRSIPALHNTSVGGYWLPFLLQDASSVLGLTALLVAAAVWWRRTAARPVPPLRRSERIVVAVSVGVVLAVTTTQAATAFIGSDRLGAVVVALAFRLPVTVAVVLVLGAAVLVATRAVRTRRGSDQEGLASGGRPRSGRGQ